MKFLLVVITILFLATAYGDIEHMAGDADHPTAEEIEKNRACFGELSHHGCDEPGEKVKEFRVCLHEAFPKLSDDCKKMMSNLYRRRD